MENSIKEGQKKLKEALIKESSSLFEKEEPIDNERIDYSSRYNKYIDSISKRTRNTWWKYIDSVGKRIAIIVMAVVFVGVIVLSIKEIREPLSNYIISLFSKETSNNMIIENNSSESTQSDEETNQMRYFWIDLDNSPNLNNDDVYAEYLNSDDSIKMTVRVYMEKDESGKYFAKNSDPILVIVTLDNIGELSVCKETLSSCTDRYNMYHHHVLDLNISDKYGNMLSDTTEGISFHDCMIGNFKLNPGESIDFIYYLAPGSIEWKQEYSNGYVIENNIENIGVELYDYSQSGDTIVDFIGKFSLTYNFGKGAFHKISAEISIPVLIVR